MSRSAEIERSPCSRGASAGSVVFFQRLRILHPDKIGLLLEVSGRRAFAMFPFVLENNVQSSFRLSEPCKFVFPGLKGFLAVIVQMPRIGRRMQGDEPHREFWLAIGTLAVVGVNCFLPCLMQNDPRVFTAPKEIVTLGKVSSPIVNILDWSINRLRHA